jgi:hypothetical protein
MFAILSTIAACLVFSVSAFILHRDCYTRISPYRTLHCALSLLVVPQD